jgi:probable lipoprotein NlpC
MSVQGITFNKDDKGNIISATIDLRVHQALFDKFFSEVVAKNQPNVVEPVRKPSPNELISGVLTTARTFLGTKHVIGGTTKAGIDCSGLSSTAYAAMGVKLPRSSGDQAKVGTAISRENLRAGDLVFFATDDSRPKVITHVGIVTQGADAGDAMMIHASTSRGVVEERLFSDYYTKRYLGAVRVV